MWEITAVDQGLTLLYAFCWGVGLAAFYDLFRALRRCGVDGVGITAVFDVIFWVVSAFATFFLLLARENGELRLYVLLGELSGGVLFRVTVSRLLFRPLVAVFRFFARVCRKICSLTGTFFVQTEKTFKKWRFRQKNA